MAVPCADTTKLFLEERLNIHKLLANNPNYFGTVPETNLPVVQPIKLNTSYEELTCIGIWPEQNLLEATIEVKLPFGFLGNPCLRGSYEYVRFYIDWNNDGDFVDFNEDAGVTSVNVHDIPQVKEHPLCYAVRQTFRPFFANCQEPYIVKLRAILSWEVVPTGPNFIPVWGNILECWIQIDPVNGRVIAIANAPSTADATAGTVASARQATTPSKERVEFLELIKQNPNYFGTEVDSTLAPVFPLQCDTQYEELHCIGLYPEQNFLEAVLEVKLPYGFLGGLCTPGSYEYVRFFIDWNGDGDFVDFNEDAGVAAVNVHDIPQVRQFHLCYALGRTFRAFRANCQRPFIVKVRAILSWQAVPTGPNFIPVWGNVKECWVQIRPTEQPPRGLFGEITSPVPAEFPTCVSAEATPTCGLAGVTIVGSAGGTGFVSYRIEYHPLGGPPVWIQASVVYPDCSPASVTPDDPTPRFAEPLAYLTTLEPDSYAVRLTVNGVGGPLYAFTTFDLKRNLAFIEKIGQVDARIVGPHPVCVLEPLKLVKLGAAPADPETSVGGSISIVGSADFWGCGREMVEWALQYFAAPPGLGPSPAGPPPPPPMVLPPSTPPPCEGAVVAWAPALPPLPISISDPNHPRVYSCLPFIINQPNYVIGGRLTRVWANRPCVPGNAWYTDDSDAYRWGTASLNGRYTVRLRVRNQDLAHMLLVLENFDAATVWIDNHDIQVRLAGLAVTGGGSLDACAEVHLSEFLGHTADIRGRAWDPLILDTEPSWLKPNNNFDHYELVFEKDGAGVWVTNNITIPDATQRVPNTLPVLPPPPGDVGVLATWDIITALDAGPPPVGPYVPPPYPKLYRGEFCAYLIQLYATDNTQVNDRSTTHYHYDYWPFCIVNDLK